MQLLPILIGVFTGDDDSVADSQNSEEILHNRVQQST